MDAAVVRLKCLRLAIETAPLSKSGKAEAIADDEAVTARAKKWAEFVIGEAAAVQYSGVHKKGRDDPK